MSNELDLWGESLCSFLNKTAGAPQPPLKKWTPKPSATPLAQLSEEEWNALSPKAKWDSIVGLRGPDLICSDTLKWFTSSVIRYRLGKVMRTGGLVNAVLGFVVLPSGGYSSRKTAPFDCGHFINHIHEAADWLAIPIAWCSTETFEKMLAGVPYTTLYEILAKELPTPFSTRFNQLLGKVSKTGEEEAPSCPE